MFGSNTTVIFVNHTGVSIYFLNAQPLVVTMPPEVYNSLEIYNTAAFRQAIIDAITKAQIKPKEAIVALSEDTVFTKTFAKGKPEEKDQMVKAFLETLPLDLAKVSYFLYERPSDTTVYATHKEIIRQTAEAFLDQKWKISGIMPVQIFPLSASTGLLPEQVVQIAKEAPKYRRTGFLASLKVNGTAAQPASKPSEPNYDSDEQTNTERKHTMRLLLLLIIALLLAGGLGFFFFRSNIIALFSNRTVVPKPSAVASSSAPDQKLASPSATPGKILTKDNVTVVIFNGTGITGQAGKVKTALIDAGFVNVIASNTAQKNTGNTTVAYKKDVPKDMKSEIEATLTKDFTVDQADASDSASYDVQIVTGK